MENELDRERRKVEQRATEVRKLRMLEQRAVQSVVKLGQRDRLKAAFHLTRAWREANKEGLRKQDFQDAIFRGLQRPHGKRQEFRLTNWTLKRGEDPTTQDLLDNYKNKSTPQKALEPYLVGLTVAAEHCGADPDEWKIAMARDLSIWSLPPRKADIASKDDRPTETLAILLNALCSSLAQRNRLKSTFEVIDLMGCRWDMFTDRLIAEDQNCMEPLESPIVPVCKDSVYFEEMFPFPSIPLLRVPYAVGKANFILAPEQQLRPLDRENLANGEYFTVGLPFKAESPLSEAGHYNVPGDAPGLKISTGDFFWFREIRLCIAPDGQGGFASALESRPHLEVEFEGTRAFAGRHRVLHGYEIDLERGLFYGSSEDGGPLFPTIRTEEGEEWRIKMQSLQDEGPQIKELTMRGPREPGWFFDPEPVFRPDKVENEPWYLSYTPATQPYIRHWLTQTWHLASERAVCPWNKRWIVDRWDQHLFLAPEDEAHCDPNVPPFHELNFPDFSHATWIETGLHNGTIEKALQMAIDHLQEQTARLQSEWYAARERHSNALIRRWTTTSEDKENYK